MMQVCFIASLNHGCGDISRWSLDQRRASSCALYAPAFLEDACSAAAALANGVVTSPSARDADEDRGIDVEGVKGFGGANWAVACSV